MNSRPPPALLALAVLLAVLLAACAKRETPAEAGIRTQTLLVGNASEPASLDPHLALGTTDQVILGALFEGLTVLDEQTSQPLPGVAARWEVSADGLVYTFRLRPDARWSNGDPVTAGDFAFSFGRILDPKLAAHYAYMLWPIKNAKAFNTGALANFAAVGVEVVDPATLRLTLEQPTPYLPALAAHMTWLPVHRATVERFGAAADRLNAWAKPGRHVGNGAFTLAAWRANTQVVVKKNPFYWDAADTSLAKVVFFPTESPDVEERNFRAGQVHTTVALPSPRIAYYRENSPALLRVDPITNVWYIQLNTTRPPLDKPLVRQALISAIDRQKVVDQVLFGSRTPAGTLVPPAFLGYTTPPARPPDFTTARRQLAEAGFPEGRGLPPIEFLVQPTTEHQRIAEHLQETWRRELGITVTISTLEAKTLFQRNQLLAYGLTLGGWVADFADPVNFLEIFLPDGGNNWTGWKNAEYARLLEEAARTGDPAQRFALFHQAETLLLAEAPIAPLYFDSQVYLLHRAVKGWTPAPLLVRRFQRVSLEP